MYCPMTLHLPLWLLLSLADGELHLEYCFPPNTLTPHPMSDVVFSLLDTE